jgi:hypothetical protein
MNSREGEGPEVASARTPERFVLRGQPPGPAHLGGRGRKVVVPNKRQLLAEWFLHGDHAADPPGCQARQLAANLLITLVLLALGRTPTERRNRVERRDRGAPRTDVSRWIGTQNCRNVSGNADPIRHVNRRARSAESGAAQQSRRCPPVSRLHGAQPALELFGSGQDGTSRR